MSSQAAPATTLTPLRASLYGAGVIGIVDFAYATIFVVFRGRPWYRPWQAVASAVLGSDSFAAGYASVRLGIVLHFVVATCIAATYVIASRSLPILRTKALPCGLAFGVIAFFVMNLVVIPLTRIGPQPLVWSSFNVGGLLVHALLLGPAAAYFAGRAAAPGGRARSL